MPVVGELLPELEESKGALYEIGIADDGTLVGLAEDEMQESLQNLRVMAASLGCSVRVLRMVPVGECEWYENIEKKGKCERVLCASKLWVAEAFVKPMTHLADPAVQDDGQEGIPSRLCPSLKDDGAHPQQKRSAQPSVEQLRISLTGSTMSGKSTLLGTLTTSTLDDGRGKSRLNMLRHRHEIASGMTSSVTQELFGYRDSTDTEPSAGQTHIVNYACTDVSSWNDIHASTNLSRLVFLSDSAGHPRYRRTTVRGLIGWAPHWTFLCIAADNAEDTSGRSGSTPSSQEILGTSAVDIDLSRAHLELCLKLNLPLVVVITKLDLASKAGLRLVLSGILSSLKSAGRRPVIMSDGRGLASEADLQFISPKDAADARRVVSMLETDHLGVVPIVLTSSVNGTGVGKLHALLRELAVPLSDASPDVASKDRPPPTVFHIEDVYSRRSRGDDDDYQGSIVTGHLRYGQICVGDELVVGPFPVHNAGDDSDASPSRRTSSSLPTSRSFPGALRKANTLPHLAVRSEQEWRHVKVLSIRNLRLPVHRLSAGQVGSIGVAATDTSVLPFAEARMKKGMVLAGGRPSSRRTFLASFGGPDARSLTVGSAVVAYSASVRASAKVVMVAARGYRGAGASRGPGGSGDDDPFPFGFDGDDDDGAAGAGGLDGEDATLVRLQFIASREYVETGARVLVMPGGGPGLYVGAERGEKGVAGLEGFVGKVVDDVD